LQTGSLFTLILLRGAWEGADEAAGEDPAPLLGRGGWEAAEVVEAAAGEKEGWVTAEEEVAEEEEEVFACACLADVANETTFVQHENAVVVHVVTLVLSPRDSRTSSTNVLLAKSRDEICGHSMILANV
jgi:hypothetical protein